MRLAIKLACWVNSSLVSPFSTLSMHLYMDGPVLTFYATQAFWTKSTKITHSSGVPESNLGILITYLAKVLLWPRLLFHKLSIDLLGPRYSFSGRFSRIIWLTNSIDFGFFFLVISFSILFFFFVLSYNLRRSNVTLSYAEDKSA